MSVNGFKVNGNTIRYNYRYLDNLPEVDVGDLKSDIDAVNLFMNDVDPHPFATDFKNGVLDGTTGAVDLSDSASFRVITPTLRYAKSDITVMPLANYRIYFCYYQSDGTFINNSGWRLPNILYTIPKGSYYRMQIAEIEGVEDWHSKADVVTFVSNVAYLPKILSDVRFNTFRLDNREFLLSSPSLRDGTVSNPGNAEAICVPDIQPFGEAENVTIFVDGDKSTGISYKIIITTYSVSSGKTKDNSGNRLTKDQFVDITNGFFQLNKNQWRDNPVGFAYSIVKYNGSTSTPIRIADNDVRTCIKYTYKNKKNTVVNTYLQSLPVQVRQWGYLPKPQAFTIYNGYVYSISGTSIAKSDLMSNPFTIIEEKSISLGHGNSLQRGSGNLAYASGWNDNTVYIVDLDSMTVTGQITLPTTGYTTCAVDDEKGLVYIFQRDSSPGTSTCYSFIVYDYVNETILKTAKTISFSAMQACDLFEDKIIVASGLATNESPNMLRVYSTEGNVLSTYYITDIANEFEGVCLDRDTHTLYVSDISQRIYVIDLFE